MRGALSRCLIGIGFAAERPARDARVGRSVAHDMASETALDQANALVSETSTPAKPTHDHLEWRARGVPLHGAEDSDFDATEKTVFLTGIEVFHIDREMDINGVLKARQKVSTTTAGWARALLSWLCRRADQGALKSQQVSECAQRSLQTTIIHARLVPSETCEAALEIE